MADVEEGDFVRLDYSGKTSAGKVFDTTSDNEARRENIYRENVKYRPVLAAAGKGQMVKGLDEAVLKAVKGKKETVTILPEKGFGKRNPELVRLVPLTRFQEQGVTPAPGMPVELDGVPARVQSVSGGRVRVDFNHELAGQTLEYEFKVLEVFKKPEEKVAALTQDLLPECGTELKQGVVTVKAGEKVNKGTADYVVRKNRFVVQLLQFVPEVKRVEAREEWVRPEEQGTPEKTREPKTEKSEEKKK